MGKNRKRYGRKTRKRPEQIPKTTVVVWYPTTREKYDGISPGRLVVSAEMRNLYQSG